MWGLEASRDRAMRVTMKMVRGGVYSMIGMPLCLWVD